MLIFKVKKDGGTALDTPVELQGSADAMKKAEDLINELTAETLSIFSSKESSKQTLAFMKSLNYKAISQTGLSTTSRWSEGRGEEISSLG